MPLLKNIERTLYGSDINSESDTLGTSSHQFVSMGVQLRATLAS